jgi:hypothetical protein
MSNRRKIPSDLEAKLLTDNLHTCCICHENNLHVQIHHIDGNPANNLPGNLAVLCLNCHSRASGDEGLGKSYSAREVIEYKKRWELRCAETTKSRAVTIHQETSLASHNATRTLTRDDLGSLYANPDLARNVGSTVGVEVKDHFGPHLLEQLVEALDRSGRIRRSRPNTLEEYDPRQLIYESAEATKVIFPHTVLTATVPAVEELAVWVADPDVKVLEARSDDRYDFAGTFLYLITPLYTHKGAPSFYTGCSALQTISNIIAGKDFIERARGEPLGRGSYLHPTDKLKSLGGIVIDRRPIQALYMCRYMTDEQCFIEGKRTYRGHDLLAYPLIISNSDEYFASLAGKSRPSTPRQAVHRAPRSRS